VIRAAALALMLAAGAVSAQEVAEAPGAMLRGLDKISGETTDIPVKPGQTVPFGRLLVTLSECRYPVEDPSSNAFARLSIVDSTTDTEVFAGWMIADSPALSALDHQRYDVWVIRCSTN
jgi:hypothetical protein